MTTRKLLAAAACALLLACGEGGRAPADAAPRVSHGPVTVKAGVAVVDMTPPVGYCSGQYCDYSDLPDGLAGGEIDPNLQAKTKRKSTGVQSRLTARAIVVEGNNGQRIALLKTDNYLAQDMLQRRVAQLLEDGDSGIGHGDILHHVSHNHSSSYASTLSWGVWLFQDVWDFRFFEYQARRIAAAIEQAAADLRPARMSATTVKHTIYKGNVVRLATADDGTPAGYPLEYGDHGLVVMRFDDMSDPSAPEPLAVWANWGQHPESLDGHDLHTADYLAALERFVDRDLGVPLVISQGDVGSAENSGNRNQLLDDAGQVCGEFPGDADAPTRNDCPAGQGVLRDFNHAGYVQTERNVRYLADDIVKAFHQIGEGQARVPWSADFPVQGLTLFVPGPVSHPYPSISNCRSEPTVEGNPGVPVAGLPDCQRQSASDDRAQMIVETLKAEGIPVPEHYDATGFGGVEENLRIMLQAFRLGEVALLSCACEAQADLILNLESRADAVADNIYDGFDWACLIDEYQDDPAHAQACALQRDYYDPAEFPTGVPGDNFTPEAIARMRAQVHNDAAGWDEPANALAANAEPADPAAIWGNFSKQEIQELGVEGYLLPVGIGHAGDYNGYTVSYREYMNRDHYRKALTSYGPHTADYMASRLVRMAAALKSGPELAAELLEPLAMIDEARQSTLAAALGPLTSAAYDAWRSAIPAGADAPAICTEALCGFEGRPADIEQFSAARFSWLGGNNAIDNPVVKVWRLREDGSRQLAGDMSGEVQTRVHYPQGVQGVLDSYSGTQRWIWTANFEAYAAFPARLDEVPPGRYEFEVHGRLTSGLGEASSYWILSPAFRVLPYAGPRITDLQQEGEELRFSVPPQSIPRSYASDFAFIADDGSPRLCETCTFRPWAAGAALEEVSVSVAGNSVSASQREDGSWSAPAPEPGQVALIQARYADGRSASAEFRGEE